MEVKNKSVKFVAKGLVYGYFWGGGEGSYPTITLNGSSFDDIVKQAEDGLDGSLDSGMGFESLIGALLNVTKIECVEIDGKDFYHEEPERVIVGKLTKNEISFLENC